MNMVHRLAFLYRRCRWAVSYERLLRDTQPGRPDPVLLRRFHETGTAFVHIPKTAGLSVSAALLGMEAKHRTWEELQRADPKGFAGWRTVAIVRDPIDRFLSAYDYLLNGGRTEFDLAFRRRFLRRGSPITAFLARHLHPPSRRVQVLRWVHFRPQRDFVASAAGMIMVRRLIPFDRLGEMLPDLLPPGAGLPRVNVTQGARTTRASLSADDVDLLLEIYQEDVALFQFAHAAAGTDVYGRSPQECAAVRTAR
jgi:hypothetical protein